MKHYIFATLFTVFSLTVTGSLATDNDKAMAARIIEQQDALGRDQYDSLKDASRKPLEVAQFFGVVSGMTVLDMTTVVATAQRYCLRQWDRKVLFMPRIHTVYCDY